MDSGNAGTTKHCGLTPMTACPETIHLRQIPKLYYSLAPTFLLDGFKSKRG